MKLKFKHQSYQDDAVQALVNCFIGQKKGTRRDLLARYKQTVDTGLFAHDEEVEVKIKVWDSPGQERFKSLILNSVKNTQGIFLVFDVSSQPSFDDLQGWISMVADVQDPKTFPFIIIANKIDLVLEGKRVVTKEEAQAFADKYGLPLFETSAKSGQGVEEAFQTLIQKVYDRNKEKKKSNFEIQ